LAAMGCDQAQGYFISRPISGTQVADALGQDRGLAAVASKPGDFERL
jgi:EAL domain-containing protein (putative c-di-GMP-specific phosphodiesterase class I)